MSVLRSCLKVYDTPSRDGQGAVEIINRQNLHSTAHLFASQDQLIQPPQLGFCGYMKRYFDPLCLEGMV